MLRLLLLGFLHLALASVLHELGHAVSAWALGWRVPALGCGTPIRRRSLHAAGSRWFLGTGPLRGLSTWCVPPVLVPPRAQHALVLAAGPVVNLVFGAVALAFPGAGAGVGAAHLVVGVANLLPTPRGELPSDGTQLGWLLLGRRRPAPAAPALRAMAVGLERLGVHLPAARAWLDLQRAAAAAGDTRTAERHAQRVQRCVRAAPSQLPPCIALWSLLCLQECRGHAEATRQAARALARAGRQDPSARALAADALSRQLAPRSPRRAGRCAALAARSWRQLGYQIDK